MKLRLWNNVKPREAAPAGMEPRRFDGYLERQEAK